MSLDFGSEAMRPEDLPEEGLSVAKIRIETRTSLALWPGDGLICVRLQISTLSAEMLYIVDRKDRHMELRAYRFGMLGRERPS